MKPVSQIIKRALGDLSEQDTPKQKQIVDDLLAIAVAWDNGDIPLDEARELCVDGWLRAKVGMRLIVDPIGKEIWNRFVDALIAADRQDCAKGGYDHKGMYLGMDDIRDHNGWVQSAVDPNTGEVICRAYFPRLNLPAPPKPRYGTSGKTHAPPQSMAEWYE